MNYHKYKVCVYAICKNESKFVDRWYESVKEADEVYVLDTGSIDDSVAMLENYGVFVQKKEIVPWRFDVARNEALSMVPNDADICVCCDLDEVYEPGWRRKMEEVWASDTTRLRHIYNWKIVNDKPVVTFYYGKTHKRKGYMWIHPVHEILKYELGEEKIVTCDNIVLNHFPDYAKSRGEYLQLLELSVAEDPDDDRNMHYLGREYMYHNRFNEAIDTLIKHLALKKSTWQDERAASMRYIARCYRSLHRPNEAKLWYLKAIEEAPYLRDAYVEYATLLYELGEYTSAIHYLTLALTIKSHPMTYINEIFSWDYTIDNLLSCCYFFLGINDISLFYNERALKYDDKNEMLIKNHEIIKNTNEF